MGQITRWRRYVVVAAAVSIATMLGAVITVTAMAATRAQAATIDTISGAVSCPAGATRAGSFVLPSVANGTYDGGWIGITNASPTSFDWALASPAHINMAVVIVQGGGNSAVYTYDYLTGGLDDSGASLQAPGGTAITKVEFCLDDKLLRDIIVAGGSGSGGGGGAGGSSAADLAVTGLVNPSVAKVGDTITWRLNVVDKNKAPATALKLTIDLSGGIEYVAGQTDRGSGCKPDSPTKIICNLDYLSSDSPIGSVIVLTKVTVKGQYGLVAVAMYSQADLDPADNTLELKASSAAASTTSSPAAPKAPRGSTAACSKLLISAPDGKNGKGIVSSIGVTFRTRICVNKATRLVVYAHDRTAKVHLTMLTGSRVGSVRVGRRPVRAIAARTSRATTVGVVVVVSTQPFYKRHRVALVLEGTQAGGKRVRLSWPVAW